MNSKHYTFLYTLLYISTVQEKLKLISSEKGEDFQLQEIVDELQEQHAADEPMASVKVEPSEINENGLPLLDAETPPRGPLHPVGTKAKATPCSQADRVKHEKLEPEENESNDTENAEETMLESKPEEFKIPSEIIVPDGNHQELDDDVVTDGSEKDKGNVAETKKMDKEKSTGEEGNLFIRFQGQKKVLNLYGKSDDFSPGP